MLDYIFIFLRNLHTVLHSVYSVTSLCDPMTVAHQAPLSMKFSRQEYWSGLPFPPPGDFPNSGKSAHDFYIGRQILYH